LLPKGLNTPYLAPHPAERSHDTLARFKGTKGGEGKGKGSEGTEREEGNVEFHCNVI